MGEWSGYIATHFFMIDGKGCEFALLDPRKLFIEINGRVSLKLQVSISRQFVVFESWEGSALNTVESRVVSTPAVKRTGQPVKDLLSAAPPEPSRALVPNIPATSTVRS